MLANLHVKPQTAVIYGAMASEVCSNVENDSGSKFGPLTFTEDKYDEQITNCETQCLLCEDTFNLKLGMKIFLFHLFEVHNIVIEEVQDINYLEEYVNFWREKFEAKSIESVVPSVSVDGTGKTFYLLSSLMKEDKELRHQLKLKYTLKVQEFERTDKHYLKQCLFCRLQFEGTRHDFLHHLSTKHNLQLGHPENLVYVEELIDKIENSLVNLRCIFCNNEFAERQALKEHMRKKIHKRIHPKDHEYDKFYMLNYLELDKNWAQIQKEEDIFAVPTGDYEENADEDYFDWCDNENQKIICLFCTKKEQDINQTCLHMVLEHNFDFVALTKHLDFYQKIKLVNYIRRQSHDLCCFYCNTKFESTEKLECHLRDENHFKVPEISFFDQPEFYFPTYENDAFLYFIDDLEE